MDQVASLLCLYPLGRMDEAARAWCNPHVSTRFETVAWMVWAADLTLLLLESMFPRPCPRLSPLRSRHAFAAGTHPIPRAAGPSPAKLAAPDRHLPVVPFLLFLAVATLTPRVSGQSLTIDKADGDSPYEVDGSPQYPGGSYQDITIGTSLGGTLDQVGGNLSVVQGELELAATQGVYGILALSGGSCSVSFGTVIGEAGAGTINQTGGTFTASGTSGVAGSGLVYLGDQAGSSGTLNLSAGTFDASTVATFLVGNNGTGTVLLSNTGLLEAGTLTVGNAAGTGTVNLNGGTLQAGSITTSGGTSTFNFNGGTLQATGNTTAFLGGLGTTQVRGGGAVINTGAYNVTVGQALVHSTISGDSAQDGGLTKLGTGTLTLTGTNTFTGVVALNAGTLNAGSAGALGNGGTISFNGGTLQYSAASANVDFSARFSTVGGQAINLDTNGQNVALGTSFGSNYTTLTKLGTGTLILGAANTYSGGTNLAAGTVLVNSPQALGANGTITFGGGTLQYGDATYTDAQYNAADPSLRFATAAGQAFNIDTGSHSIAYTAALTSNGGTLTKLGAGTLALNGKNAYTGMTTISAGTLLLDNSNNGGGAVFVDSASPTSNATLGGTVGTVSAVTVHNGTVNPGNNAGAAGSAANVGTLSVGSLQLDVHSILSLDVNGAATYDQLASRGNVALGSSALSLSVAPTASFATGQTLDLVHLTGGSLSGTFAGITNGGVYTFGGDQFQALYTATDFQLVAVPEPGTGCLLAALLALGGAGVVKRRRSMK